MAIYKRGATWWVDITHQGGRDRRSTGTADRQAAQRFHDELRADLWRARKAAPDRRTFRDAIAIWLETGEKGAPDRYRLRDIGLADTALADITEQILADTLAGYRGATRNRVANLLHAVMACAVKRGWIERIPHMARVRIDDRRIRWLTADEWRRLQAELPCHLRQMARFAIATGLRASNVTGLEWSQIDLARRVAWVHGDQTKTGKPIGVPLSDDALRVLEAQRDLHQRYVFVYAGRPVLRPIGAAWSKAVERADLGDFRWHDLRHTWASWHVMNGTPLEVLQKLGGWKTLQMVMRYAHLAPEHLAQYAGNSRPLGHNFTAQQAEEAGAA